MDEAALLTRLHTLLQAAHMKFGHTVDPIDAFTVDPDTEVYPCGPSGVLAFIGEYVLAAWPDAEHRPASRAAYRLLEERLATRGLTRHMVHPLNFRSVIVTRKLGAKPLGVDNDGYVHYLLTRQAFEDRHRGKKESAAQGT